jgi:hypothetical protein
MSGEAITVAGCSIVVDSSGLTGGAVVSGASDAGMSGDASGRPETHGDEATDSGSTHLGPSFEDTFDREDGESLGNGWTEKTPSVLSIVGGKVVKSGPTFTSYRDNMAYRPPEEDRRDVEVSIEVDQAASDAFPQIFLRAQRATLETANRYQGYLFYRAGGTSEIRIGRQQGSAFVSTLASVAMMPPFDSGTRYRFTASAHGESLVELAFVVERFESGEWVPNGSVNTKDSSADRISTPGAVGFAADESAGVRYDAFSWRALAPEP